MTGKLLGGSIVIAALIAGAVLYYLQIYAFYSEVDAPADGVTLVLLANGEPEAIPVENFQAIDADSSPIRYRACFTTPFSFGLLTDTFVLAEDMDPRNAPKWFDCFNSRDIGAELEAGTALTFMGQKNVHFGVDRIVAITEDGRGYIWHELNDCGEKAYDGTVVGEKCPSRPAQTAPTE